ncbi:hypothetical protein ACHAXR_012787 [Thalassiosira sp. AJA248-18]
MHDSDDSHCSLWTEHYIALKPSSFQAEEATPMIEIMAIGGDSSVEQLNGVPPQHQEVFSCEAEIISCEILSSSSQHQTCLVLPESGTSSYSYIDTKTRSHEADTNYRERQQLQEEVHHHQLMQTKRKRMLRQCTTKSRRYSTANYFKLAVLILLSISQIVFIIPATAQDEEHQTDEEEKLTMIPISAELIDSSSGINTEDNKFFCGLSYDEAHEFCHLPPHKSLPCPNGEDDCPYNMPCWEIEEACTYPPTELPTASPTESPAGSPSVSPITDRSANPGDHNFCGLGFNNLFGCAINCPNGSPSECPHGQLCYFNTPCDARYQGRLLGDPTLAPTPPPTLEPTISPAPTPSPPPTSRSPVRIIGKHNFCGTSHSDASENCNRERHCPSGNNEECAEDMFCFVDVDGCDIREQPSMKPTISPKPTDSPSYNPTTQNPAYTPLPTNSPLDKDDIRNFFFCGKDWGDASKRCHMRCLTGEHFECPEDEECFANVSCKKGVLEQQPTPALDDETDSDQSTSPTQTASPTPVGVDTDMPTYSPLEKDDYRNYFFCGTSWRDATERCYKRCLSGQHSDCPSDEECFSQADCKNGVQELKTARPTNAPTPSPFDGTLSPTISPEPTNFPTDPNPTMSPVFQPTKSPANIPTDTPTTPFPTHKPTYAPCAGEPCKIKEFCRSNQNFCGSGKFYCNEKSIWTASCGTPTDPPTSAAPTTIWPSLSPSISILPTKVSTNPPTENPTQLSDLLYYLKTEPPTELAAMNPSPSGLEIINHPSIYDKEEDGNAPSSGVSNRPSIRTNDDEEDGNDTSSPTFGNVDDKYYAPNDPLGSFFCGTDWNHAITECPNRCPSGESTQCPKGWSCYAFTPCLGVGVNKAPTAKPTWEPTKKPTPKPTRKPTAMPTTKEQHWAEQNEEINSKATPATQRPTQPTPKPVWWTPAPSPKPSYTPTEDQCRGVPCDYEGECRSRLGFCGTGIVYCNSASSWIPACPGGGGLIRLDDEETEDEDTASPNTMPTAAPTSSWQAWVANDAIDSPEDDADIASSDAIETDSSQNINEDTTVENATSEDSSVEKEDSSEYAGYNPDVWANWGSESRAETDPADQGDLRWWTVPSSTTKIGTWPVTIVSLVMIFMAFTTIEIGLL